MRIALIAPTEVGCTSNAGAHMITAGIRYLVRTVIPAAQFVMVDMLREDARQWEVARTCRAMILCGNPRFSVSAENAWWEDGIWSRIQECAAEGVRVIDGWGGTCVGLYDDGPLAVQAEKLLSIDRTQRALRAARCLHGAITRDRLAMRLYLTHGIQRVHYLPCSSWFARGEHQVKVSSSAEAIPAAIVLLALAGHEWAPEALTRLAAQLGDRSGPCPFIATTWADFVWARDVGLERIMLVSDPASLLSLYARIPRLVSLRIHASIPAASMHCEVCTLAVDSRARTLEPFRLPVQPFTDLQSPDFQPRFGRARAPDFPTIIETVRSLLTC